MDKRQARREAIKWVMENIPNLVNAAYDQLGQSQAFPFIKTEADAVRFLDALVDFENELAKRSRR